MASLMPRDPATIPEGAKSTSFSVITAGSFTWYRVQIRDGLNTWPGPVAVPVGPVDDSDCEYVNRVQ